MPKKKIIKATPLSSNSYIFLGSLAAIVVVLSLISIKVIKNAINPADSQCSTTHVTTTKQPKELVTAMDYFLLGDYDYDRGNCRQAIADYTQALNMNPAFVEALNNRGYTYMRLREFANALPDLNKAISLRPEYVNARMNRGDMYNFDYNINYAKALQDYNAVRALGPGAYHNTNLCGHRILAQDKGWSVFAVMDIIRSLPQPQGPCRR